MLNKDSFLPRQIWFENNAGEVLWDLSTIQTGVKLDPLKVFAAPEMPRYWKLVPGESGQPARCPTAEVNFENFSVVSVGIFHPASRFLLAENRPWMRHSRTSVGFGFLCLRRYTDSRWNEVGGDYVTCDEVYSNA